IIGECRGDRRGLRSRARPEYQYPLTHPIQAVNRQRAAYLFIQPAVIDAKQLLIIRSAYDRVVSGPDHLAGNCAQNRPDNLAVGPLPPFLPFAIDARRGVYVFTDRVACAVRLILPVAAAEHLVVTAFALQNERPFDRVPSHAAFFDSTRVV